MTRTRTQKPPGEPPLANCSTCEDVAWMLDHGAGVEEILRRIDWPLQRLAQHLRRCGRWRLAQPFVYFDKEKREGR